MMKSFGEPQIPVVRHGQFEGPGLKEYSYENFIKSLSSDSEQYPLTKEGEMEIERLIDEIPDIENVDVIFTSDFLRTRQTAEIIARKIKEKTGRNVFIHEKDLLKTIDVTENILSEQEFVDLKNSADKDAVANTVFERWASGKFGESPELVEARIKNFLKYLRRVINMTSAKQPLVITHSSFGSAVQRFVQGKSLTAPRDKKEILNTSGYYLLKVNSEKRMPSAPGIQQGEFEVELLKDKFLE